MTRPRPTDRIAGWLLAGAAALGLVGGAAAFALAAERRETVLILDLGRSPLSAPVIAAVSDAAPRVAAADPSRPPPLDPTDAAPVIPAPTTGPMLAAAAPMSLPDTEPPVTADLSLPPEKTEPEALPAPTTRPKARPDAKRHPTPEPETKKDTKRTEPGPTEPARAEQPAASASAPSAAAKAMTKGGDVSPAAYARAVMRKVRATKRKSGAGKGTVVVGFTIAADGGLASVQVLQGSGDAALDASAVDHIRRSAPFPPPGANAGRGYAFEFVGK
jgi:periplasmic protein TonB